MSGTSSELPRTLRGAPRCYKGSQQGAQQENHLPTSLCFQILLKKKKSLLQSACSGAWDPQPFLPTALVHLSQLLELQILQGRSFLHEHMHASHLAEQATAFTETFRHKRQIIYMFLGCMLDWGLHSYSPTVLLLAALLYSSLK